MSARYAIYFTPPAQDSLPVAISLALFVEPEPGAPFEVRAFRSLGRRLERKTA